MAGRDPRAGGTLGSRRTRIALAAVAFVALAQYMQWPLEEMTEEVILVASAMAAWILSDGQRRVGGVLASMLVGGVMCCDASAQCVGGICGPQGGAYVESYSPPVYNAPVIRRAAPVVRRVAPSAPVIEYVERPTRIIVRYHVRRYYGPPPVIHYHGIRYYYHGPVYSGGCW